MRVKTNLLQCIDEEPKGNAKKAKATFSYEVKDS